jgi:acyl carrier protein phosphodiesterase
MNHLAHFHLSWPREDLVVGALEGDFYRGTLPGSLNPALVDGVILHRAVDGFTDSHPLLAEARSRFPEGTRRYAGIMLDLCFDYFLSRHWQNFSGISHGVFSREVYTMLRCGTGDLSERAQRTARWLEKNEVLTAYRDWRAVTAAAARVGTRLSRANPLHRAGDILEPLRPGLEQVFLAFYPELARFSHNFFPQNAKLSSPQQMTQGVSE